MKAKNWMLRCIPFVLLLIFVTIATTACGKCEHEWGEWTISIQSTCSEQGTKHRVCYECGEMQYASLDVSEHQYDFENIVWSWNGYDNAIATVYCMFNDEHTKKVHANITDEVIISSLQEKDEVEMYGIAKKFSAATNKKSNIIEFNNCFIKKVSE